MWRQTFSFFSVVPFKRQAHCTCYVAVPVLSALRITLRFLFKSLIAILGTVVLLYNIFSAWLLEFCFFNTKRKEGNRGRGGLMASLTQWTWVWADSRTWWRTEESGMLQSLGSQTQTWLSDWTTTKPDHITPLFYSFPTTSIHILITHSEVTWLWCVKGHNRAIRDEMQCSESRMGINMAAPRPSPAFPFLFSLETSRRSMGLRAMTAWTQLPRLAFHLTLH